jgi:hypothetical protein
VVITLSNHFYCHIIHFALLLSTTFISSTSEWSRLRQLLLFGRAGPSLSAYNYDSVYGKRALAITYKTIMEQVGLIFWCLFQMFSGCRGFVLEDTSIAVCSGLACTYLISGGLRILTSGYMQEIMTKMTLTICSAIWGLLQLLGMMVVVP